MLSRAKPKPGPKTPSKPFKPRPNLGPAKRAWPWPSPPYAKALAKALALALAQALAQALA